MNEILARLAAMPDRLRTSVEAFAGDVRQRPAADLFSLLEHACHLRDIEQIAFADRIRRMLAESDPELADVDGARLAAEADYNATQELDAALAAFTSLRAANVDVFSRLSESEWSRTGSLEGAGRITLAELARRMDKHDREHAAEIEALIA